MARVLEEVGFVHLHVHSSYSLLEGALKIDDLKKQALGDKMPALALTDTNNLFWRGNPADHWRRAVD